MLKLSPQRNNHLEEKIVKETWESFCHIYIYIFSIMYGRKNNSILQLGVILNNEYNEAIVLENVNQIMGTMRTFFFRISSYSKKT